MKLTETDGIENCIADTIWGLTKENIELKKQIIELKSND